MATVLDLGAASEQTTSSSLRSAQPVLDFAEARRLAERYGTPTLVISRSALLRNYQAMRTALPEVDLYYAAKANPADPILRTLHQAGSFIDVCSYGEMLAALQAGFAPEQMIHTHPCKTVQNLVRCYAEGMRWFTFDNVNEIPKLVAHTPDVNLLLRLAVSSSSSLINLSAKFGASEADAVSIMLRAREAGLQVKGMSFHVGSQCREPEDFRRALAQARRIWDRAAAVGIELQVLDLGGGFPAPYRGDSLLTLEAYCRRLAVALDENFRDVSVRVIAEPGRGMCADTATLITSVIGKSVRGDRTWYIIDDGIYGSFSGQIFDHVSYPLLTERGDERPLHPCVVAGPTCDSTDIVCKEQMLPELEIGELLLVPTMGAYTSASASTFNGLDLAKVVAID